MSWAEADGLAFTVLDAGWEGRNLWTMPHTMRVEYPGAIYHVMDRGDRREDIFVDDVDREDFLKTLAEACRKTDWQVHAYCLMRNHFHLLTRATLSTSVRAKANSYQLQPGDWARTTSSASLWTPRPSLTRSSGCWIQKFSARRNRSTRDKQARSFLALAVR